MTKEEYIKICREIGKADYSADGEGHLSSEKGMALIKESTELIISCVDDIEEDEEFMAAQTPTTIMRRYIDFLLFHVSEAIPEIIEEKEEEAPYELTIRGVGDEDITVKFGTKNN